ncbi:hypothetical protein [Dyella tabacisoli]|uniref:Uncharacterized protein n=1 Tax=Dyella tabacisoli TaxID=2282381 RepID=A0A369URX4_9GAMM|nr:hypothetical protein [Dyella tabacisoli]RDD83227.1 hypothetical protein DVJ77_01075 [Dyella tabacisoli]
MIIKSGLLRVCVAGALLFAGSAQAGCWSYQSGPTYDSRWYLGVDNVADGDDASLLTDNALLQQKFPSQCGGQFGCDVVSYSIQWGNGSWSAPYYPGVNDTDWVVNTGGYQRRVWSYFYDHNFQMTYCN